MTNAHQSPTCSRNDDLISMCVRLTKRLISSASTTYLHKEGGQSSLLPTGISSGEQKNGMQNRKEEKELSPNCPAIIYFMAACSKQKGDSFCVIDYSEKIECFYVRYLLSRNVFHAASLDLPNVQMLGEEYKTKQRGI